MRRITLDLGDIMLIGLVAFFCFFYVCVCDFLPCSWEIWLPIDAVPEVCVPLKFGR